MADSTGVSAASGFRLTDWEHTQQSISRILTTFVGSLVMRRDFGSELPEMVDRRLTQRNVLGAFAECALAIKRWEKRFEVRSVSLVNATVGGRVEFLLRGVYYPRGHLNDFSVIQDASTRVVVRPYE